MDVNVILSSIGGGIVVFGLGSFAIKFSIKRWVNGIDTKFTKIDDELKLMEGKAEKRSESMTSRMNKLAETVHFEVGRRKGYGEGKEARD